MPDAPVRGRFVWHELMTPDTKSAASFFTKIAGWNTQAWEQDPSYVMFLAKRRPVAGLTSLSAEAKAMGAPPSWLTYIGTPDVDETARQATSLGAKVLKQPTDIPTMGRFAIFQDPQGAVFAAYTPPQASQSDGAPALGDFSWHELATTDWRAALTFYQRLFGWEETSSMDMGPEAGTYQMFGWKGRPAGGIFNKSKQMPGPPAWLPYINVSDSKKVAKTIAKLGGKVVNGPMEVPGGDWIAQGIDLQGAMFAVHSVKPAAAAAAKKPAARKRATPRAARKASRAPAKAARRASAARPTKGKTKRAMKKRR